ncbi:MAG: hypothetical protein ACKVZJ_11110 [Phycisphaerales bacterium]
MLRTCLIGLVSAAVIAAACGTSLARPPVGTEFTYQGQLLKAGQALTGNADFRFTLFDGPGLTANIVGAPQNVPNIPVNDGRFECAVNFGESPYTTNEERWLQVEVRNPAGGSGNFSLMGDRQKLTASPFSLSTRGLNVDAAGMRFSPIQYQPQGEVFGFCASPRFSTNRRVRFLASSGRACPGLVRSELPWGQAAQGAVGSILIVVTTPRLDL